MGGQDPHQLLIRRAREGDEVALKVLLARSRSNLCRYVSRRTPRRLSHLIDPEDIVQETHAAVFSSIAALRSTEPAAFHRWIKTIALNRLRLAIRWHRAAKRNGDGFASCSVRKSIEDSTISLLNALAAPGPTPSRPITRAEAVTAVHSAMDELPDHYRQAVWLVYIEGRPVRDAAAEMGRTERAVAGLCRRGLTRLRDHLGSRSRFLSSTG